MSENSKKSEVNPKDHLTCLKHALEEAYKEGYNKALRDKAIDIDDFANLNSRVRKLEHMNKFLKQSVLRSKIISDALRNTIHEHGPITKENISSATKRIRGGLNGFMQEHYSKVNQEEFDFGPDSYTERDRKEIAEKIQEALKTLKSDGLMNRITFFIDNKKSGSIIDQIVNAILKEFFNDHEVS